MLRMKHFKGETRVGSIYTITNTVTGKVYVGSTFNMQSRLTQHFSPGALTKYNSTTTLYSDMDLYGRDKFEVEVIDSFITTDPTNDRRVLLDMEAYWIAKLDTAHTGYNILTGRELPLEVLKKVSKALSSNPEYGNLRAPEDVARELIPTPIRSHKGRNLADPHSRDMAGEKNHFFGKTHSDETKAKIIATRKARDPEVEAESRRRQSESRRGKATGAASGVAKAVRCKETGYIYPTATAAAKAIGAPYPGNLANACKKGNTCGGYHWEYV